MEPQTPPSPKPVRKPSPWLWFILSLLLVAAAFAGWLAYKHVANNPPKAAANPVTKATPQAPEAPSRVALATTLAKMEERNQHMQAQLKALQDEHQQLMHSVHQTPTLRALMAARQFLQLANYQSNYQHDAKAAAALIDLAAAQIHPTQHPALQPIHALLRKCHTQMQAAGHIPDASDQLAQIDTIKNELSKMQQSPDHFKATKASTGETTQHTHDKAKLGERLWANTKKAFAKMVVVSRSDTPIQPLLDEDARQVLHNNLLLTLSQAQWAIIAHQRNLYHQSITGATKQIQQYFNAQDPSTAQVLHMLSALTKTPLDAPLPKLDVSLRALDQAIAKRSPESPSPATHEG